MYWKPFHKNPCKVRLNILWLCNVDYGLHKEENTLLLSYLMSVGFNVLTPVIFLIKQIPLVLAEFFVLNCPTEQYLGNAVILLSMANWNEPASSPFIRTPLKPQVLAAELWNTFPATIFFLSVNYEKPSVSVLHMPSTFHGWSHKSAFLFHCENHSLLPTNPKPFADHLSPAGHTVVKGLGFPADLTVLSTIFYNRFLFSER